MTAAVTHKLSGHQTFPFRFGWLEKGVRGVAEHPDLFFRDDALVLLGVGKNMVESIKHWCHVSQLVEPVRDGKRSSPRNLQPTSIAGQLLLDGGWDPFLEDDGSLWLIHWLIAANPTVYTSIRILFSGFNRPDFSRKVLIEHLKDLTAKEGLVLKESVIARDVDCLLRCYAPPVSASSLVVEESFACPLVQLSLVQPTPDEESYRFSVGPKPALPLAVFAYALHDHYSRRQKAAKTMSINECVYGEASPGQVFRLDENSVVEYVEYLEDATKGAIVLDETAGLKQIYWRSQYDPLAVLSDHYRGGSGG